MEKNILKEVVLREIENTAVLVQIMDEKYIKYLHQNRSNYTNEDIFRSVLQVFTLASEGVGLIKILHKYCSLNKGDLEYLEKLMEGYNKLENDFLAIYRQHSKNTEELY